jgi:hypothetical protein
VKTPLDHARHLHGSSEKGHVTIAQKTPDWQQRSYKTCELYEVLPAYGGLDDVYISQNRFYGPRRSNKIAELCALYADLDYYNDPDLAQMHPRGVLDQALEALREAKIPRPSLAISTGRGLALVWRHEPVPGTALSRWARCQNSIFEALTGLGADPSAKDPARVLRLVGTRNSKSGTMVETIYVDQGEGVWTFDDLANEILPLTREQLAELRASRGLENKPALEGARRAPKSTNGSKKSFTPASLAKDRLSDLKHLLKLRGQDKLPSGQRDAWMFVAATSLAMFIDAQDLERELILLGKEYAGWSEAETRSRMHSIISRAQSAKAGEKVQWNGQRRDTRYWLTNEEIIKRLKITQEEEQHLKTIISKDTKRQRNRERKEQKRRSEGVVFRQEYEAERRESRQHHRHLAKKLRAQEGMSLRGIGRQLGISPTQVKRLLESGQSEEE